VSVAIAVLAGCAGQPVDVPSTSRPDRIVVRPGHPGLVVGTYGGRDTAAIVTEVAQHTGVGLVVAPDVSLDVAPRSASEAYERAVVEAAQGPLRFYVEIHGHDRTRCAGQIEIATVGVDPELARRLRALAELIRDAHLRSNRDIERLSVVLEDADGVSPGVRRDGVLRWPERALQIELPRCARRDWREMYAAILADFVTQAAALPAGR
jgi:hypothetical protein